MADISVVRGRINKWLNTMSNVCDPTHGYCSVLLLVEVD